MEHNFQSVSPLKSILTSIKGEWVLLDTTNSATDKGNLFKIPKYIFPLMIQTNPNTKRILKGERLSHNEPMLLSRYIYTPFLINSSV